MVLAILLTTDNLVSMLEEKRKRVHCLDSRLRRTAFLASSMILISDNGPGLETTDMEQLFDLQH